MLRACALGLAICFGAACSATDPGVEGLTRPQPSLGSGDASALPLSDGAVGADGAMKAEAAAKVDGFTGAGAFVSSVPAQSAVLLHKAKGVGVVPSKSTACLSCHGLNGNAPYFLLAGTVFKDMAGTQPAADVEVRVRGSDGAGFIAHSDVDGNFWYAAKMGDKMVFPALTAARDSSAKSTPMAGTISGADCNGCHAGGNGTGVVHYP